MDEQGGIYLDMDVLCLRCSARRERTGAGLCNAVILSAPGSWFVRTVFSRA